MTLMKSLLLGSAAGIVGIASAQAADLPTRKGAPAAKYVRICSITVNGKPIVGWMLPGSDTCFKLTGYVTAQIEGGNVYGVGQIVDYNTGLKMNQDSINRHEIGWTTRLNFGFDAVSNTAYGPLTAHAEMQFENGNGFDNTGTAAYINLAYLTWAGITAGKAPSFFSFTGGGPGWANFFSPDQQGFNQPDLLAYTASFGGGFSATVAAQSPGSNGNSGGGTYFQDFTNGFQNSANGVPFSVGVPGEPANYVYNGDRVPDFVANLKVSQGWGSAQVSGVAHYLTVTCVADLDGALCPGDVGGSSVVKRWGWGVDAGVSFNLPQFGAGDEITLTGVYTENAAWYSGLPDGMWGENGQVNGNGKQMALADIYFNPDGLGVARPDIWSVAGEVTHHFSPEFSGSLEGAYGQVRWTGTDLSSVVSNSNTWLAGVVAHWDPVKNLDFEFELLYQYANTQTPNGFIPGATNPTWQRVGDGFAARFEVTRSW
jgi:hypothetical protein